KPPASASNWTRRRSTPPSPPPARPSAAHDPAAPIIPRPAGKPDRNQHGPRRSRLRRRMPSTYLEAPEVTRLVLTVHPRHPELSDGSIDDVLPPSGGPPSLAPARSHQPNATLIAALSIPNGSTRHLRLHRADPCTSTEDPT